MTEADQNPAPEAEKASEEEFKFPIKTQADYIAIGNVISNLLKEAGVEAAVVCIGSIDQTKGASHTMGPKPSLLQMIRYINDTLLPLVAPHVKVKLITKRI